MCVFLEDWAVVGNSNPYTAPENRTQSLKGVVSGHPFHADGERVRTSAIQEVCGNLVVTYSRKYILGNPNPEYVQWCKDNGCHVPTKLEPIKVNK